MPLTDMELEAVFNFVLQEGAKTSEGVIVDYDKFIIQKINEFPVTLRPRSGADDRILQISLDGTQDIRHVKAKVSSVS